MARRVPSVSNVDRLVPVEETKQRAAAWGALAVAILSIFIFSFTGRWVEMADGFGSRMLSSPLSDDVPIDHLFEWAQATPGLVDILGIERGFNTVTLPSGEKVRVSVSAPSLVPFSSHRPLAHAHTFADYCARSCCLPGLQGRGGPREVQHGLPHHDRYYRIDPRSRPDPEQKLALLSVRPD